jgi:hypothetical protein
VNGDPATSVNSTLYAMLANCSVAYNGVADIPACGGIPLEYFLYIDGVYPVTSVTINGTTYDWKSAAYVSDKDDMPLVTPNGSLYYRGQFARVDNVEVSITDKPGTSTLDIEPSVLYALDAGVTEKGILPEKTDRVVLIYIDAFGYERYLNSTRSGLVGNVSALGTPIKALAVYPSVSQVNAKAMATGVGSNLVKGDFRSEVPDNDTMLDILNRQGRKAVWVDGTASPVDIDGLLYNNDTNRNGSGDDEAADAAIRQYKAGASLVIVHFDSTDKIMHQLGPDSPQAEAAMKQADALVGRIVASLDRGTAVVVWADHGCHTTKDGGNHGTLLPDDMYVPIFVHYV